MTATSVRGRVQRALGWALTSILLFVAVATLRVVLDGEREIAASDVAFDANDLHGAIQHARRAASAYAPGAPHVERAYQRLLAVARGAEATGRPELAMLAWQAQRAAVLESASLWHPFSARLEEADRNLARLSASKTRSESELGETAQKLFKQAQNQNSRGAPWGGILGGGLLVAAAGLAWFTGSALEATGAIRWRRGIGGLIAFGLGAALWAAAAVHG